MRLLLFALALSTCVLAQTTAVPEPQYVAVDSKDNLYVAIKYGIVRITPDGAIKNLTTADRTLDRSWKNLIVDSKDNLYANDGKLIYKFTFRNDQLTGTLFAGRCTPITWRTARWRPPDSTRSTRWPSTAKITSTSSTATRR